MKLSAGLKQNLISAGFILSVAAISTAQDAKPNWRVEPDNGPPLEAMVDVGGHRLHVNCAGQGNPVVDDCATTSKRVMANHAPDVG